MASFRAVGGLCLKDLLGTENLMKSDFRSETVDTENYQARMSRAISPNAHHQRPYTLEARTLRRMKHTLVEVLAWSVSVRQGLGDGSGYCVSKPHTSRALSEHNLSPSTDGTACEFPRGEGNFLI